MPLSANEISFLICHFFTSVPVVSCLPCFLCFESPSRLVRLSHFTGKNAKDGGYRIKGSRNKWLTCLAGGLWADSVEKIFLVFATSLLVIFIIYADVKKQTEQKYINKKFSSLPPMPFLISQKANFYISTQYTLQIRMHI